MVIKFLFSLSLSLPPFFADFLAGAFVPARKRKYCVVQLLLYDIHNEVFQYLLIIFVCFVSVTCSFSL
jgi:hypothetical protein